VWDKVVSTVKHNNGHFSLDFMKGQFTASMIYGVKDESAPLAGGSFATGVNSSVELAIKEMLQKVGNHD
jgi:hypothetical protein